MHFNTIEQFGMVFSKNINNYNLAQTCWDKIENLFSSEKSPLPQTNVVGKVLGSWQQNLATFNNDIGG